VENVIIAFSGEYSGYYARINCLYGSTCSVICGEYSSCEGTEIYNFENAETEIFCNDEFYCPEEFSADLLEEISNDQEMREYRIKR